MSHHFACRLSEKREDVWKKEIVICRIVLCRVFAAISFYCLPLIPMVFHFACVSRAKIWLLHITALLWHDKYVWLSEFALIWCVSGLNVTRPLCVDMHVCVNRFEFFRLYSFSTPSPSTSHSISSHSFILTLSIIWKGKPRQEERTRSNNKRERVRIRIRIQLYLLFIRMVWYNLYWVWSHIYENACLSVCVRNSTGYCEQDAACVLPSVMKFLNSHQQHETALIDRRHFCHRKFSHWFCRIVLWLFAMDAWFG